jgi:H+-transporting ATPase
VTAYLPFDPVTKRTEATLRRPDGGQVRVTKGAPQVVAGLCEDAGADGTVAEAVRQHADRGFRSLGVARTDSDGSWKLLGVLPLSDPPREDSADTIAAARDLGVDVKMVTGDQAPIGAEIAREIGLGTDILEADRLGRIDVGNGEADLVERADGFAQVFPEHKYRIVQALQRRGHIVGMTGDGVNDAPALKQADAGIAVAGATEAARAAADVVLLSPGLSVIVEAIRLSREIFARMTSYATYRIAETIRVLLLVVLAVLVVNLYPVTATMVVLLAILNDGAILAIAYDHVRGSTRPVSWEMRQVLTIASVLGTLGVLETFLLFAIARGPLGLDHAEIQTLIYLKLSVSGHLTIFVTRTRGHFWERPAPSGLLLGAVLGTQTVATLIAGLGLFMTPLSWVWVALVWGYAVLFFLVEDQAKVLTRRWLDHHPHAAEPAR